MVNKIRKKLTERQKKVLKAIEEFILEHGYSPTIRQLGEILKIVNPSAVFKHTQSLEKKGYLESFMSEPKSSRGGRSKRIYKHTKDGLQAILDMKNVQDSLCTESNLLVEATLEKYPYTKTLL